ncbi:hypothetical protein EJ08DRAFT_702691 [Tothia fuscella]|uniref:Uncharacterized protein n=1 Tax=Tothia fuscella TaxID=1048955 RepID=A0A9P4NFW9_9PEZI|nr:hypothetical protein EJ08DRAFT_702691 [Tothia fuscella]
MLNKQSFMILAITVLLTIKMAFASPLGDRVTSLDIVKRNAVADHKFEALGTQIDVCKGVSFSDCPLKNFISGPFKCIDTVGNAWPSKSAVLNSMVLWPTP